MTRDGTRASICPDDWMTSGTAGRDLRSWTWEEFASAAPTIPFFVLAAGSIEQHGPHLPLGADSLVSETLARLIAVKHNAVFLPPLTVGVNYTFSSWPGTISLTPPIFTETVMCIGRSVSSACPRLLVVNGHDENHELIVMAARELTALHNMDVVVFEWAEFVLDEIRRVTESTSEMHAGEALTSLLLYWHPQMVRRCAIVDGAVLNGDLLADDLHSERRLMRPRVIPVGGAERGVFGRPTLATAQKGGAIATALEHRVAQMVDELGWSEPPVSGS